MTRFSYMPTLPSGQPDASIPEHGEWDIKRGETLRPDGTRDVVLEGSMESFPCSDPPSYSPAPQPERRDPGADD